MAQDRYSRVGKNLEAYQKRNMISQILTVLVAVAFFGIPGFSLIFVSSPDLRSHLYGIAIGFAVVFLLGGAKMNAMAEKLFPPIEDRAFYYLKTSIADLNSFAVNELDVERESAVKNLTRVADAMDAWQVGNIRFLRDLSSQLRGFRTNFRGRLIPSIASADKTVAQSVIQPLTGMANTLEIGTLGKEHFAAWNQWLTQRDPLNSMKEMFPPHKPSPTPMKWLASKRFHISIVALVVSVPIATAIIASEILHATVDTVVLSFSTILGGGLILLAYLIFGQRKGTTPAEK